MTDTSNAFVSVKFDAVGRVHRFLLPEVAFDPPLHAGEDVVVATGDRRAFGKITQAIPQLDTRRHPSAARFSQKERGCRNCGNRFEARSMGPATS